MSDVFYICLNWACQKGPYLSITSAQKGRKKQYSQWKQSIAHFVIDPVESRNINTTKGATKS